MSHVSGSMFGYSLSEPPVVLCAVNLGVYLMVSLEPRSSLWECKVGLVKQDRLNKHK